MTQLYSAGDGTLFRTNSEAKVHDENIAVWADWYLHANKHFPTVYSLSHLREKLADYESKREMWQAAEYKQWMNFLAGNAGLRIAIKTLEETL